MRRFVIFVVSLALVGDIAAILVAPKLIHYWFEPPVASGATAAFNCTGALDYGISRLISYQLWATVAGAVLGLILALVFWNRSRKQTAAAVVVAPAATVPTAKV